MNEHSIRDDGVCEIYLPSGHVALIDADDWPLTKDYRWRAKTAGRATYVYATTCKEDKRTSTAMHRLILGTPADVFVDHRNHDGLDNRRSNIRFCTTSQNNANRRIRSDNRSGYKGVIWRPKDSKWIALGKLNGREQYLGSYSTAVEAAQAHNAFVIEAWGEFAFLNEGVGCEAPVRSPRRAEGGNAHLRDGAYRGVSRDRRRNRWRAQIQVDGKGRHLGYFDDPWEAAQVWNAAARAAWGESAYQNERIPDDQEGAA